MLTNRLTVWYDNSTAQDHQRFIKTAAPLPTLELTYYQKVCRQARGIVNYSTYPMLLCPFVFLLFLCLFAVVSACPSLCVCVCVYMCVFQDVIWADDT